MVWNLRIYSLFPKSSISCFLLCSCVVLLAVKLTLYDGGRFLALHSGRLAYTNDSQRNSSVFHSLEQPFNFLKKLAFGEESNGSCVTHLNDYIFKFLFQDEIRPWFLSNVSQFHPPTFSSENIWPEEGDDNDRIVDQFLYAASKANIESTKPVTILLYDGFGAWYLNKTQDTAVHSVEDNCPVRNCLLTANSSSANFTDVIISKSPSFPTYRMPHQLWTMYMLESPFHSVLSIERFHFNMSVSFHHKSDIVTPYAKWVYYDKNCRSIPQSVNYATGKTKKVAWFVSNCNAKNNRLKYARELSKYIKVDIYGGCGSKTCPRRNFTQCFDLLSKHYKFYLAFENSNCRDYITEKLFKNALTNNVIPIVMGAHPDDYRRVAPEKSYIHVDDFPSPKELALHLHLLDNNDDLYNEYFRWKGTGEIIFNTHFFCRLCAMVQEAQGKPRSEAQQRYPWWNSKTMCTSGSWPKHKHN